MGGREVCAKTQPTASAGSILRTNTLPLLEKKMAEVAPVDDQSMTYLPLQWMAC